MMHYVNEQRRVLHKGRQFHFVSYEGALDKATKTQAPSMWYLMASGKRWAVCEQVRGQAADELDANLAHWLDHHIFG